MNLSIKLDDKEVQVALDKLADGIHDLREPLGDVGDELLGFYGKNVFKSQGAASGGSWRPLSASTLKMRAERRGYYAQTPIETGKILIWTGRLKRGFKKKVERLRLTIDNPVKYFKHHQLGGGHVPKRPMLAITREVVKIVEDTFDAYIKKIIKKL